MALLSSAARTLLLRSLFASTLLVGLAACGQEPEEKPAETAETTPSEMGSLDPSDASTGTPRETNGETHPAVEGRAIEDIASDVHGRLLTIDTHVDIPDNYATAEVDPGIKGSAQVDLVKMREGNLNAIFFIVYVGQTPRTPEGYEAAMAKARNKFDAIHRMTEEMYPDSIELATSADDIERIHGEGKLVALIGVENGFAFGPDASTAEEYYQRGMRYAGFAHMGHSDFADSSMPREWLGDDAEEHHGLSEKGRALLAELNRLGVMADVSHSSKAATLEIAKLSTAPILASHSGAYGVYDHVRNLSDEELLAIKETGGVVQAVAFDTYIKQPPEEKTAAAKALRETYNVTPQTFAGLSAETKAAYRAELEALHEKWPRASVSDFVDHIDYMVALIGIDHVGISSDFGGGGGITGWMNAEETPNVTAELISRGYSTSDIEKLWGGNLLRVMRAVEEKAAQD